MTAPRPATRYRWPHTARWLAAVAAVMSISCGGNSRPFGGATPERYGRTQAQHSLAALEQPGLVIGEFRLAANGVIDGDTLAVHGLDTSLRLLAIDTEEKFRRDDERTHYARGWDHYLTWQRGDSPKPVKMATPLGEEATAFAKDFFADVEMVRLERDHPKDLRGRYGRYLTYVFAHKDGQWINYNVECVRAGMAPYFMKYGYSRRFHEQFVAAMAEARAAHRGIWDPSKQHYPDYDERLRWWTIRADFIQQFERDGANRDDYIALSHWDALQRIEAHEGKQVMLLATVGDVKLGDRGPTKVLLSRRMFDDFPLIFFDKDVFGSSGIANYRSEFVTVRGTINRYHNKRRNRDELQILVNLPGQITGPKLPWLENHPQ